MANLFAHIRFMLGALALAFIIAMATPAAAQQPSSVNPTASAVKEQQLLQELNRIQGRISIPDARAGVLEQPAGRDWRNFHQVTLRW
ncbi:MAG: formate dehydrogenase subunit gamma, partial [Hyphomicrobiales bacterium]